MTAVPGTIPRALPLAGASNLRDLGGWLAQGAASVRFGLLFRSAALDGLTPDDRARLASLGIADAVDLRGRHEAAAAPSRLPAGVAMHALPIEPSVGASLRDIAATRAATGADAMGLMRRAYEAYARDYAPTYRALFDLLLHTARPLLFHCSAGKDRTGFGAALILTALGVARDDVMQDYLATNRFWRGDSDLARSMPEAAANILLRVHPELLDAAFAAMVSDHGTVGRYLDRALGLTPPRLARLCERLLE